MKCEKCGENEAFHRHFIDGDSDNDDPDNIKRLCVRCHQEIHGNEVEWTAIKMLYRTRKALIEERKSVSNRVQALEQFELDLEEMEEVKEVLKDEEERVTEKLEEEVEEHPLWKQWLNKLTGIGKVNAGALISMLEPIEDFETVSKVWAYLGLKPPDCYDDDHEYQKYRQATKDKRTLVAYDIGRQFVMQTSSFYRQFYDEKKEYYMNNRDWEKGHCHQAARRHAAKIFLSHVYEVWRRIEGLDAKEPYIMQEEHHNYIRPPYVNEHGDIISEGEEDRV